MQSAGACVVPVTDKRQGINLFMVDHHIDFHKIAGPVFNVFIVKGTVPLGNGFETIIKIINNFSQRHIKVDFNAPGRGIVETRVAAAALGAQLHDRTHVTLGDNDVDAHVGFKGGLDHGRIGIILRILNRELRPVFELELILHRRRGHDDGLVVFTFHALLHDLKMQQPQKAASKTKT